MTNPTPPNHLRQFVRETRGPLKGQPRGIVVAAVVDGQISIGWSYTNYSAGGKFDKELGLEIAVARLNTGTNKELPIQVKPVVVNMIGCAKAYFRIDDVAQHVGEGVTEDDYRR